MKKIYFLLVLCALVAQTTIAQTTYSSTNYANAGDSSLLSKARVDSLGTLNFTATGANYSWNYSTLQPETQYTKRFLSANQTGYKVSYTTACVLGGNGGSYCNSQWNSLVNMGLRILDSIKIGTFEFSNVVQHYHKNTGNLPATILGMSFGLNGISFPMAISYTKPDTIYRFPLAYLNADSCNSEYKIDLSSMGINLIYKTQTKRVNYVEGWGALTTPYKTYASTLKLKAELFHTDTLFFDTLTIPIPPTQEQEYSWFEPNTKIAVLTVDAKEQNGNVVYSNIEYTDTIRCLEPTALFVYSPLVSYTNNEITFNNTSVNAGSYLWNFADTASGTANISSLVNPSHTFTSSGTYLVKLISCNPICQPAVCDTVTIPIVVLDSSEVVAGFSFSPLQPCAGDTVVFSNESLNANLYQWNFGDGSNTSILANPKHKYTTAGTYTVTLISRNSQHADTITRQITVGASPSATVTASGSLSFCSGDSVTLYAHGGDFYQWSTGAVTDSLVIKTSGTFYVTAVNNCGSNVSQNISVSVFAATNGTVSQSLCSGGSYLFNGVNLTATGTYLDTLVNSHGCDSIVTLTLVVNSNPVAGISPATVSICNGSSAMLTASGGTAYAWSNSLGTGAVKTVSPPATTTYTVTVTNANSCSATASRIVTVKFASASTLNQSICSGGSYFFNNVTLTSAGTYLDTLVNAQGCDSVITLHLSVSSSLNTSVAQNICSGDSYFFNNQTLTQSGTYLDTLTAVGVCDSVITLYLTVNANPTAAVFPANPTVCVGGSVTLFASGGASYVWSDSLGAGAVKAVSPVATKTYTVTVTSANNCSATASKTVTVKFPAYATVNESICNGSSYLFNSADLTVSGVYFDTLTAANACDSIITLNLTLLSEIITTISDSVCAGSGYYFNGDTLFQAGTYVDTLTSATGCDSVVTLTLSVLPLPEPVITLNGVDTLATSSFQSYQWFFEATVLSSANNQTYVATQTGNYQVLVSDEFGCADTSNGFQVLLNSIFETTDGYWFVYPNPTHEKIVIQAKYFSGSNGTLKILDENGSIVFEQAVSADEWENSITISVNHLPAGTYSLALTNRKHQLIKKMIVGK